ncbi:nhl repeat-containing protein 2 [Hordeum vulgare]|nr:nhl repeat-containing protein 2 [Hordeum vulgare]
MTGSGSALWKSLSMEQKHEVAVLAAGLQRARQMEVGMLDSTWDVFEDNPTMKKGSNNDTTLEPMLVHVGLTMGKAHVHLNATMMEEQC